MQDTSPTASHRPEPTSGRDVDDLARAEVTWYEELGEQPVDNPLIALIPIPDLS